MTHRPRFFLLAAPLLALCLATACGEADKDREEVSAEGKKKKANEACGADEAAKADADGCEKCCDDNGVSSYQFDGMNKTCTCGM